MEYLWNLSPIKKTAEINKNTNNIILPSHVKRKSYDQILKHEKECFIQYPTVIEK